MPMSIDQFEHLDDFSGLQGLHVYGDFLTLYSLPVHANLGEAGRLYQDLKLFEQRLLTVYVSYILAHKGYYVKAFTGADFEDIGNLYTNRFRSEDWIKNFDLFQPGDEPAFEWTEDYENAEGHRIRVIFVTMLILEINARTGEERDEAQHLMKQFFDKDSLNLVVVHPRLSRQANETFQCAKNRVKEYTKGDQLLSTGEFVSRFFPIREERYVVEQNWTLLRERLLGDLQKEWPILIYAVQQQKLVDVEEQLRKARLKYEMNNFEDAIKDAGVSCEGLLQVLCSIFGKRELEKEMEFYDLLCALRNAIIEQFGDDVYHDLDLIREWRNKVVHPSGVKPDDASTLRVITKAELFFELFKKKMLRAGQREKRH